MAVMQHDTRIAVLVDPQDDAILPVAVAKGQVRCASTFNHQVDTRCPIFVARIKFVACEVKTLAGAVTNDSFINYHALGHTVSFSW